MPGTRRHLPHGGVCSAFLFFSAVAAAACIIPRTPPTQATSDQQLSIGYPGPGGQTELLSQLTTEPLLQTTFDGRHEPRLAESYSVAEDGRTVTLTLRQGVTFHDGVELSAGIVKESLDAARTNPEQVREHPSLMDIRTIEAAGEQLRIDLDRPSALLLDDLGIRIRRGTDEHPIGTGPFFLQSVAAGSMTLGANPTYHQGRPSIEVVSVTSYPTVRTAWAAMMRSEVDFLFEVPINAADFVEAESRVELFKTERPYAYKIGFNVQGGLLRDKQIRQALNHAVDRRLLIERALRGDGHPASGIWPSHWAYGGVERLYRYDPALADQLLTEAGYPPARSVASPDTMPSRLRLTCLVRAEDSTEEHLALLVQRQLYDVGVDMQIEALSTPDLLARVVSGEYDAALMRQNTGRALSRLYTLWHSSQAFAQPGYAAADEVLDTLRHAATPDAVTQAASAFQTILYDDPPAIFLAVPGQARAVDRRFEIPVVSGQDIMETIWRWQWAELSN